MLAITGSSNTPSRGLAKLKTKVREVHFFVESKMSFHHKRAPASPLQGTLALYMIVVVHEIKERVYFKYIVFNIKCKIKGK